MNKKLITVKVYEELKVGRDFLTIQLENDFRRQHGYPDVEIEWDNGTPYRIFYVNQA